MIIRIGEAVLYKAFEFYSSIYHHEFFLLSFIHLLTETTAGELKLLGAQFPSNIVRSSLNQSLDFI